MKSIKELREQKHFLGNEFTVSELSDEDFLRKFSQDKPLKLVATSYTLQTKNGVQMQTSFFHPDYRDAEKEDEDDI